MDNIQITKKKKASKEVSDRVKIIHAVKALKKGHCIEYRGTMPINNVRAIISQAKHWIDKSVLGRAVEGGIDIFCE